MIKTLYTILCIRIALKTYMALNALTPTAIIIQIHFEHISNNNYSNYEFSMYFKAKVCQFLSIVNYFMI
jgi:hypothetical protein